MWQQWVNFIVGIWIAISAFYAPLRSVANIATSGIIVLVLALWGALAAKK